jgi:hypothetical protein
MNAPRSWTDDVLGTARHVLVGQTPESLLAYSVAVDHDNRRILLRAHFAVPPSEDDLEDMSVVETEILAAMPDDIETRTEIEIVSPGAVPALLPGGVAYQREEGTRPPDHWRHRGRQ